MKKTLSIILVIVMLMALVPAAFADEYTITFAPGTNGTIPAGSGTATTVEGKIASAPVVTANDGFVFTSWDPAFSPDTVHTADTTYTAQYEASFTITFEPNLTDATVSPTTGKTGVGGKLDSIPTPVAPSKLYKFIGWFDAASGGTEVSTNTVFTSNSTIYAQWTVLYPVTVVNPATGGTVTADKTEAAEAETVTLTVTPSTGYHLTEIKVNDSPITGTTFAMPAAAATVTPAFAANTYTVKFHANGGTGEDKTQPFTYNEAKPLEANTYTKTGNTFLGWSTNSAAATANYGDKESVSNLTSTDGGVVDLYAIWTPSTTDYTVTMGKYSGANLGRAYWSLDQKNWYEVTNEYSNNFKAGTTLYFKMDPYNGYYRHPYVVNANGSYYSPGYGQVFSVVINENKTIKLNFSQYVPTGDAGVWGYVVTMLASAGTAAGVYFGTKKKK